MKKAEIFERYSLMRSQELSDATEHMKKSDCVNKALDLFQSCFLKFTHSPIIGKELIIGTSKLPKWYNNWIETLIET